MSDASPAVRVDGLEVTFRVPEREAGLAAAARSLFVRRTRTVAAVRGASFEIGDGEVVGFLGSNGAGKTTTLKALSGLLHPTGGSVHVLGHVPSHRERAFLSGIALLMGGRNQLQWDLPAIESFELSQAIYQIPDARFRRTKDELVDLLDIGDLLRRPVRNLSLGERMKVELAGSLLHRPRMLFLDEPTLGLDAATQRRLRSFIADHNRRDGTTVLLTSHYPADIEALCARVVIINRGRIQYDGPLDALSAALATSKEIRLTLEAADVDLSGYGQIVRQEGHSVVLTVPKAEAAGVVAAILAAHTVVDLVIEDPPVEDVIDLALSAGEAG
ncbi:MULTISPECIES: ATP-binding cassette domain-containing protein [Actinosynnema]|uniref:ABC transporter ATP-binding protein n=1 Tax=Actinosynnema TaxID=40566 RepID=UPI0020A365E8|nr:ATP-binding cassette domain-containing protein [Actinosynnema pretiosum]MCP2097825.1 ABC-2 type transport system ATP-binding protein [Actinosynnema pretiosum]